MSGALFRPEVNSHRKNSKPRFLFHDPKYLLLCNSDNVKTFEGQIHDQLVGIQFQLEKSVAHSPVKASFGGIINYNKEMSISEFARFFSNVEEELRGIGIDEIIIRGHPIVYDQYRSESEGELFVSYGYESQIEDLTQYLVPKGDFEAGIKVNEQQKLKRAQRVMRFEGLAPDHLEEVYDVIRENRQWKGYPLTTEFGWLQRLFQEFPNSYKLFGVYESDMVAAAVVVQVSDHILYTFYLGDLPRTRALSPIVFLLKGIYDYAIENGYKLLDLGVSTEHGIKNEGLYTFKKNLGAADSKRVTWHKKLR